MPLLGLPPEIRSVIWDYCLGQNYIHITEWPKDHSTTHALCCAKTSDFAAYDYCYKPTNVPVSVMTSDGPSSISTRRTVLPPGQHARSPDRNSLAPGVYFNHFDYLRLHESCLQHIPIEESSLQLGPQKPNALRRQLHLSLMRTSKLIYDEAFEATWTRNTFAFDCGSIFGRFIAARTNEQRHALRHMVLNTMGRLSNPLCYRPTYYLDLPAYGPAIAKLPALTSVFLNINYYIYEKEMERFMCEGVLALNGEELDVNVIDMLRLRSNLHTMLTQVLIVATMSPKLRNIVSRPYSDLNFARDLGKAIDCIVMSGKSLHEKMDATKEDKREVKLDLQECVLQKRGAHWRQRGIN